ncbi:DUF1990 family protein [Singulisphaera sp. PoT]|uniref:DUF1990 family protein n=1 Tax=Singulisphaera sp. PoT TaxID=3411797 RepID=UPI003BF5BC9E
MAKWRFGRGWTEAQLKDYLNLLEDRPVNFDVPIQEMTADHGWTIDGDDANLATEPAGPPLNDGPFARARQAIMNYDFSDPSIVMGHYDPDRPLKGRVMLLELKVLGFRFLGGVRVMDVREEVEHDTTLFGFRYDTLQGHIEQGFEWFLLTKDHTTGSVDFRIQANWRLGDFPNWWSRVGFLILGDRYRRIWRHRAPERLRRLAHLPPTKPVAEPGELAHRGDTTPRRTDAATAS